MGKNVALLRLQKYPCHVGLMVSSKLMLHVEHGTHAVVEEIDRAPWRGKGYDNVEGVYRYAE